MELKQHNSNFVLHSYMLLIVPYGIETSILVDYLLHQRLLIVPYGIETLVSVSWRDKTVTFNRTLWNWNSRRKKETTISFRSFNRTLWNWNYPFSLQKASITAFNRTLWNWNVPRTQRKPRSITFNRTLWNWNNIPVYNAGGTYIF